MAFEITWRSEAEKQFNRLPQAIQNRVDQAVLDLRFDPRPAGAAKCHGKLEGHLRVKVGRRYRVLYRVDDVNKTIRIVSVGSREGFYG